VVVPQYRLDIYGFFNFRKFHKPRPGRYNHSLSGTSLRGVYDQLASLQWVQRYIGDFKGDKKRVTLGGWSAGACSAALLTLAASSTPVKEYNGGWKSVGGFQTPVIKILKFQN